MNNKRSPQRAADQLVGWLLQAKSRAMRDQSPHGLRFVNSNSSNLVDTLEYIYLPEPFLPRRNDGSVHDLSISAPGGSTEATQAVILGYNMPVGTIAVGDILEVVHGTPTQHYIESIAVVSGAAPQTRLALRAGNGVPAAYPVPLTTKAWRVLRDVRPVAGEQVLHLPKDIGIDWLANQPAPTGYDRPLPRHILFSPVGTLLDCPRGRVALWVRHREDKGEPIIVSINGRNAAISQHPVAPAPNPFQFCDDGLGSGL